VEHDSKSTGNPQPKFALGGIVISANASSQIGHAEATKGLARHSVGDWGEVGSDDRQANEDALAEGSRLLSVYRTEEGTKFWIITEWDRSYTTVLLPEDY